MSRILKLMAILLASSLVIAACGSGDSASRSPRAADAADEDPPSDLAIAGMTWDQVLTQAQEEGSINWNHWYLQERIRPFVERFTDETGIEVNVSDGNFDVNEDKLLAESDRSIGTIDVMSYDFPGMSQLDMDAFFMPLNQLPDFDSLTTELEGVDTGGKGIAWWGNQSGIAYDATRVDEADLPQTFQELTAWIEANPNGFGINDPSMGGAGGSFIQAAIRNFSGSEDYFDLTLDEAKVSKWEPAWVWLESVRGDIGITGNNADTLTRINDGEFMMGPGWEDQLSALQKEGEISSSIGFYIPDWGMNGGANSIVIPNNAEHPAAAMVFIDWITSPEIQSAMNENFGVAPQHPDASEEFALVPASQRVNKERWFAQPYSDRAVSTFVERILGT